MNKIIITFRLIIAIIFLQTLFFKFTASPESVYIFSKLGIEPFGRIASGIFELIAAILLLLPRTYLFGAILSFGIISGAVLSHIFVLGFVVQDDGGLLFILSMVVFLLSIFILLKSKNEILNLLKLITRKK